MEIFSPEKKNKPMILEVKNLKLIQKGEVEAEPNDPKQFSSRAYCGHGFVTPGDSCMF
jgi:hypothetical protein